MPGERPADAVAYMLVVAGSVSLVWRRRAPIAVLAGVCAAVVAFWLRDHGAFVSVLGLSAFFAVAAHAEHRRRAWWALGAGLGRPDARGECEPARHGGRFRLRHGVQRGGLPGRSDSRRGDHPQPRAHLVDTERRAATAEADRVAEAERAVVRERSRIAREMHDVVAHSMSVVAVQAAAGREIVHTDPDKAAEVFAKIEAVGRESLTELRRMLGVLRTAGDEAASLSPQPGIAEIVAAVAESSATGVATELVIEGRQRPLAPGVELTAFRIVQEALTNVRKHGGRAASATVRISYETDVLVVEVTDDGRGAATSLSGVGTGHGLIGMRERVEIYGGEFTQDRDQAGGTSCGRPAGGFDVHSPMGPGPHRRR